MSLTSSRQREIYSHGAAYNYIVIASDFSDGGRFNDRFINTFHQNPVTSGHPINLHTIPVTDRRMSMAAPSDFFWLYKYTHLLE